MTEQLLFEFIQELKSIDDLDLLISFPERERFSKDFFDYSPILFEKFSNCCADIVLKPSSIKAVSAVAAACYKKAVPLTLRGSGTGNYGQSVPLQGGVVMLMSGLNVIRKYNDLTGEVTVEPGCLISDLDKFLAEKGRQLRLLPSTWRTATIGGFVAGGSGGIGSIRWGFLRDPGHLIGLEVITTEKSPQKLHLDASGAEPLNHAYGTNGIFTALTLSTTTLVKWHQVIIDCENWPTAIELLRSCSNAAVNLFLGCLLEVNIVDSLPSWSGRSNGNHRLLLLVDPDALSTIERLSLSMGASFHCLGPEGSSNGLRELSWNHTTLHMRAIDPNWTYLQMLLPQCEIEATTRIKNKWGNNLLWHLEAVRQNGAQRIAALPLVNWQGVEALQELISDCEAIGAIIFNPHAYTVEDGGLGIIDGDQVDAKRNFDPKGLLNPGKLKGWG